MILRNSIILYLFLLVSCANSQKKTNVNNDVKCNNTISFNGNQTNKSEKNDKMSKSRLINTKWIIGKVGVNGEKPDTIVFNKSDSLTYISNDTGAKQCLYTINNDTLTFNDYIESYDYDKGKDVIEKYENKLILSNGRLLYVESILKTEKTIKVIDLRKNKLFFREI